MKNYTRQNMYILESNNISDILDYVGKLINNLDVIILDSLPTLTDTTEEPSKIITKVQRLISLCNRNKVDLYIVNQLRYSDKHEDYTYYLNRLRLYYNKRIKIN